MESDRVAAFLKEVEGKNVEELITAGREKLASMPAAGAAPAAGGGGGGGGGAADAPKAEEKKEEESEDEVRFHASTNLCAAHLRDHVAISLALEQNHSTYQSAAFTGTSLLAR